MKEINTYGDDNWATPTNEEEIKLTFSEWVKKQLTQKQVEERLKNRRKSK